MNRNKKRPHRRTKVIGGLLLLAATVAIWLHVVNFQAWRLYPYIFPQHVCFTSDGADTGQGEHCLIRDARTAWMIYEERALGSLWTTDDPFTSVYIGCQKACQANSRCTHYVITWPREMYNNKVTEGRNFSCSLLKSR